ncbi:hypoxanthine phosphoribosyltransferase [Chrysiogenes arsenatis]|uniref:hypoxanthine phosphoribosyltransferase n=1 Tax=Chrysiogenes arsenatis TaxID=309797 RepID=UPI000424F262|nr:hypoxanthine phosphoribosyltransferase [Chrysiogenes arsenatis]
MTSHHITPLIDEPTIARTVQKMAAQIATDFTGESLTLVCILNGSLMFTADLARALAREGMSVEMDCMRVSSYADCESTGSVKVECDLSRSITDKNVLIVEDIIDTGQTLGHLMRMLSARNPKRLELCCFLDKPSRRVNQLRALYTGIAIEDHFVVGYGLDFNHTFRELPYVGVLRIQE